MEIVGLLAAACVLATFCMQSIIALRAFAIASNVLFIIYGAQANLPAILLLHTILLPINSWALGTAFGARRATIAIGVCAACASLLLIAVTMRMQWLITSTLAAGAVRSLVH